MTVPNSISAEADEQAFAWATRIDGGLTPAEQAALDVWLALDPAHAWRLAHYQQFYAEVRGSMPVLHAEGRLRPLQRKSPLLRWTVGLTAAAALIFGLYVYHTRPLELTTASANRQSITLEDGTHTDLNARTELSIQLHGADRHVRLTQGEAFFAVAKDPSRPFFVETPAGTVRVTGTKFNVRATHPGELEVTVLEGSVQVSDGNQTFQLKPDDQVVIAAGRARQNRLSAVDAENVVAWRDGKVIFDDTPLSVALARFADYHGREVTLDPVAGNFSVGGRYTLDDFDDFVAAIEKSYPLKALRQPSGAIRMIAVSR